MDIVTHSFSGLYLSKILNKKHKKKIFFLFVLSALLPDIDILFWGEHALFEHRMLTHSLLFLAFAPIVLASIFYFWSKKKISFCTFFSAASLGIATHFFLDVLLIWGMPFFSPWNTHHFSLNLYVYVFDPLLYFSYVLGCLFFLYFFLVRRFIRYSFGDDGSLGEDGFSSLKKRKKYFSIFLHSLAVLCLLIFSLRLGGIFYAKSLSPLNNPTVVPVPVSISDLFFPARYRAIEVQEKNIVFQHINIFSGTIYETYEKKKFLEKNTCRKMHEGFLFEDNGVVGDIRYTYSPKISEEFEADCFFGIAKEEVLKK